MPSKYGFGNTRKTSPYKMKGSPFAKKTKSKTETTDEEGINYTEKKKEVIRGDKTKTKTFKASHAHPTKNPDLWLEKSKVKKKDGKIKKSRTVTVDKGGNRKTIVTFRRGKTKTVVLEKGKGKTKTIE